MLNKVILIGRLTRDPELKYTSGDGVAVANFTLAVDRFGEKKEADFIRIVTWKKQAENCSQYTGKGSLVAVEGRLQVRQYEDREGNKRTIAEVSAQSVRFLDKKGKSEDNRDYDGNDGAGDGTGIKDGDAPF